MAEIVLTADRATLSSYHDNLYLGFLSCLSDRLCPEPIYKAIVTPVQHDAEGSVILPNLSLRAVEAACLAGERALESLQILHDAFLESKITKATRIVGVSTHDPLGFGPATTTWSTIFKGTPYNRIYFLRLMDRIKALKRKFGFTVVVGGPGDWQVSDPETMDALGIDYVVFGEGEIAVPKLFEAILRGDPPSDRHVSDRALEVMRTNRWFAVCTLICGLPEERAEDIQATTDLIRKIGKFEALYIPLFFAPLGLTKLQDRERFVADHMLREHWELMLACWDHNFRHIYKMYRLIASEDNPAFRALIRSSIAMLRGWVGFRRGAVLRRLEKRMKS